MVNPIHKCLAVDVDGNYLCHCKVDQNGPRTQSIILILARPLPLVAFHLLPVSFCWWLLVAGLYEEKVGPMPLCVQVLLFAVPTIDVLWYFVCSIKPLRTSTAKVSAPFRCFRFI